jgi:hypothetical protein
MALMPMFCGREAILSYTRGAGDDEDLGRGELRVGRRVLSVRMLVLTLGFKGLSPPFGTRCVENSPTRYHADLLGQRCPIGFCTVIEWAADKGEHT